MAVSFFGRFDTWVVVFVSDLSRYDTDMGPCLRRGDGTWGLGVALHVAPDLVRGPASPWQPRKR